MFQLLVLLGDMFIREMLIKELLFIQLHKF